MTREQAIAADWRTELHAGQCIDTIGPRGGRTQKRETWRVNGACQTWKTRPDAFRLPIKYGFNGPYSEVNESNMADFHLAEECKPTMREVETRPRRRRVLGTII